MLIHTNMLLEILYDIRNRVAAGDSVEGNLSYRCLGSDRDQWEVSGAYRVGPPDDHSDIKVFPATEEAGDQAVSRQP
jgi:hypothetical protein